MNALAITAAVFFSLSASAAYGACTYPRAPEQLPDGEKATKEEMLAAKKVVTQYNNDITAYLNCLQLETDEQLAALEKEGAATQQTEADKQAFKERKEEFERRRTQRHNAAFEEVTAVVDRFNEQLRAYKKKHGG